jgi:hypothetical protein
MTETDCQPKFKALLAVSRGEECLEGRESHGQKATRVVNRHGNRLLGVLEVADMVPPLSRDIDPGFAT